MTAPVSPWTPERDAMLTKLWLENLSTAQIGRQIGVTKYACIGRAHRIGLPKRDNPMGRTVWTSEMIERAEPLIGIWSFDKIGREFGVSGSSVHEMARRRGMVAARHPRTPVQVPTMAVQRDPDKSAPRQRVRSPVDPDGPSGRWEGPGPESCRYITGEPKDMSYCTEKALPGKAWCSKCLQVVYYSIGKDKRIREPA